MGFPIAILAFNRPAYLEQVLRSVKAQQGIAIDERDVFLFQDGAVNAFSGKRHASDDDISANITLFKDHFPNATIFHASSNLGVALNFDRAERYVFDELQAPVAYFFEDDLELGPYYLKTLDRLADIALSRDDIGYFAAYGDHTVPLEEMPSACSRVTTLWHNWGFGLTRSQWRKSAPYVDTYLSIVRNLDYRDRPASKIAELFQSWGCGTPGTSQDVAKTLACYLSGSIKINTLPTFACYIGKHGVHTTAALFRERAYERTTTVRDDICAVAGVGTADRARIRKELEAYSSPVATREDVIAAYRYLLGREPESEDVINACAGRITREELRQMLLRSKEFFHTNAMELKAYFSLLEP